MDGHDKQRKLKVCYFLGCVLCAMSVAAITYAQNFHQGLGRELSHQLDVSGSGIASRNHSRFISRYVHLMRSL